MESEGRPQPRPVLILWVRGSGVRRHHEPFDVLCRRLLPRLSSAIRVPEGQEGQGRVEQPEEGKEGVRKEGVGSESGKVTWNELANLISSMPEEVREYTACVWLPYDYERPADDFARVVGLSGYDGEMPVSEDNLPSIEIEEG